MTSDPGTNFSLYRSGTGDGRRENIIKLFSLHTSPRPLPRVKNSYGRRDCRMMQWLECQWSIERLLVQTFVWSGHALTSSLSDNVVVSANYEAHGQDAGASKSLRLRYHSPPHPPTTCTCTSSYLEKEDCCVGSSSRTSSILSPSPTTIPR